MFCVGCLLFLMNEDSNVYRIGMGEGEKKYTADVYMLFISRYS